VYWLTGIRLDGDSLRLRMLDPKNKLLTGAHSRRDLESVVEEHVESDALYEGPPVVFRKMKDDQYLRKVMEAFQTWDKDES